MKKLFCRALALLLTVCMTVLLLPAPMTQAAGSLRTVWDMETLPSDLVANTLAVPYYLDTADYKEGNVTVKGVNGKGRNGSRALAITQVGECVWADIFNLYPERDKGAAIDLGDAQMIWFWADASAFTTTVSVDLRPDDRYPFIGDRYYTCAQGKTDAVLQTITDAWDGVHGRINLTAGFRGWVGIPLSSLVTYPETLQRIYFYMSIQAADANKGKTLYLDDFTLSAVNEAPDGIRLPSLAYANTVKGSKTVWDMEALPDDLLSAGLAVTGGAVRYNLRVQGADGKGFDSSRALRLYQYGPYSDKDTVTLNLAAAEGFDGNWRGGDMLMLWVDASEFAGMRVSLDVRVGSKSLSAGANWYKERNGLFVKAGTCDAPYENAGFGRITLFDGYCGWLGIPLSAFAGGVHQVSTLQLYVSYTGTAVQRKSVYLDAMQLISGNRLPDGTATGAGMTDSGTVVNASAQSDSTRYINVNPAEQYQTMQAYGASDCWWTNVIGMRSNIQDVLDLVWGKDGAGLNNYRLNVGGSVKYARSDGPVNFSRAALSPLDENGNLDITRNIGSWNTYSALLEMVENGSAQIDDLTLFMNSPPSTYMVGGTTNGDVLKTDYYDDYAEYVADVVSAYGQAGLAVKYVSPINEPLMGIWARNKTQEGVDYANVGDIVNVTAQVIQAVEGAGLSAKVSTADFNCWTNVKLYLDTMMSNAVLANHIDHIAAHSYFREGWDYRTALAEKVESYGLASHMTEWAMARDGIEDNMDTAIETANMLYYDLAASNVDTWSWWIACGGGGCSDALMYFSLEDNIIAPTKRLWAIGQLSLFTVGATRIGVNTEHLPEGTYAMAFTKGNSLIYNFASENYEDITLSLAGLPAGADGKIYVTTDEYNCELLGHVKADRAVTLPARSVVTVVFEDIDLSAISTTAVPSASGGGRMLDMENCSANGGVSTNQPGLVSAYIAEGKGEGDSRALALSYNQWDSANYWDTALRVSPAGLGSGTDWSAGELLWFRVDASEFSEDIYLQLDIGDGGNRQQSIGATFCRWNLVTEPMEDTAVKTWDGATYGRMRIPAGYVGYLGVPFAAYETVNQSNIKYFSFYFEPAEEDIPCALYLDEFWLTDKNGKPVISAAATKTVCKDVFDMECLQEDLTSNSGFASWGGKLGTYIDAVVGTDRGLGGTAALGYRYLTSNSAGNGSNALQIDTAALNGFDTNWRDADYFWFWVDTSAFSERVTLGVQLNWVDLCAGNTAILWNGETTTEVAIPIAYDSVARTVLPAGYVGFVGLPLDGYREGGSLNRGNVHTVNFYYDCGSSTLPVTLWLDEFWVISGKTLPPVSFKQVEHIAFAKEIWNLDSTEGLDTSTVTTHYSDPLGSGNANAVLANNGCCGSTAFGYVLEGAYTTAQGDNNLCFNSPAALGIDNCWTGADLLWFWVDASEYNASVRIRLKLNWVGPAIGSEWYLWDGEGARTVAGTMKAAYGGADFGSFELPTGYVGYVCLPLSAFRGLDIGKITSMIFHIDANSTDLANLPKTLWFDEFWVTAEDGFPTVPTCAHKNTEAIPAVPATCTGVGYTEGVRCADCSELLTAPVEIAALGHDYVDGICSRCGAKDPDYAAEDPCEGYTDINRSSWYHTAADYVIENGYMGSTKTDALTFEPNTKVSRAMVASILYRIAGSPAAEYKASFTDVPSGKWFTAAIEWCAQNGLASGKGAGKFDPNGNVTRQELAVFMYKLAEYLGSDMSDSANLSAFADGASVPGWARSYLQWAVATGLISGKANGSYVLLAPKDNATRAEFASIIMRFMNKPV